MYSLFINVLHAKGRFSKEYFYNLKKSVMKVEKFKVLLYLKKSEPDKTGKAPIMGRITLNRTMAQFSCKLSCTPGLWNARESRLNGKSREAVETNEKIERLLPYTRPSIPSWKGKRISMPPRSGTCSRVTRACR